MRGAKKAKVIEGALRELSDCLSNTTEIFNTFITGMAAPYLLTEYPRIGSKFWISSKNLSYQTIC